MYELYNKKKKKKGKEKRREKAGGLVPKLKGSC